MRGRRGGGGRVYFFCCGCAARFFFCCGCALARAWAGQAESNGAWADQQGARLFFCCGCAARFFFCCGCAAGSLTHLLPGRASGIQLGACAGPAGGGGGAFRFLLWVRGAFFFFLLWVRPCPGPPTVRRNPMGGAFIFLLRVRGAFFFLLWVRGSLTHSLAARRPESTNSKKAHTTRNKHGFRVLPPACCNSEGRSKTGMEHDNALQRYEIQLQPITHESPWSTGYLANARTTLCTHLQGIQHKHDTCGDLVQPYRPRNLMQFQSKQKPIFRPTNSSITSQPPQNNNSQTLTINHGPKPKTPGPKY